MAVRKVAERFVRRRLRYRVKAATSSNSMIKANSKSCVISCSYPGRPCFTRRPRRKRRISGTSVAARESVGQRLGALCLSQIAPRLQQDDVRDHSSSFFFGGPPSRSRRVPPSPLRGFGGPGGLPGLGFGAVAPAFCLNRARFTSRGTLKRSRGSLCWPPGRQSRPRFASPPAGGAGRLRQRSFSLGGCGR